MKPMRGHGALVLWLLDKLVGGLRELCLSLHLCPKQPSCKVEPCSSLAALAMAMAMGGSLLQHHLPSSALPCISSTATSSPHSASSCGLPSSNSCSVTSFVLGGHGTTSGVTRVETLRAAGSEVAAPAPVEEKDGPNLPCDTCNSKGWLVCDFCKGQKTNVQVRANKFYRRCPSCRAVGVVICAQCKVFKCVTFPDGVDGY